MIAKPRRLREAPTKPPAPRRPVSAMPPCDLRTDATDGLFLPRLASLAAAAYALESDGLALAKPFGEDERTAVSLRGLRLRQSRQTRREEEGLRQRGPSVATSRADAPQDRRRAGRGRQTPPAASADAPPPIAWAFLKNASAVSLDETTASLDPESETRVQRAIAALAKGKPVLMVAHRIRTAPHAHRIVVLDVGRVVEKGGPPASSPRTAPSPASTAPKA